MKFLPVFAALVAVALSAPLATQWTLPELSAALENPSTDPAMIPYLQEALNEMMINLMTGGHQESITVVLPAEVIGVVPSPAVVDPAPATVDTPWTLEHLSAAIQNPNTNPELLPYLESALNEIMETLMTGGQADYVMVPIPVGVPLELAPVPAPAVVEPAPATIDTPWTLEHLSNAIQNPNTNPEVLPYLEAALNEIMETLMTGGQADYVMVPIPVGVPLELAPVPAPAVVEPAPATIDTPWTLEHLSNAIQNPNTNPEVLPYLEAALNEIMETLMTGGQADYIMVPMPVGVPLELELTPAAPVESPVTAVETPASPVESPLFSSPIVQIIVNINSQEVGQQVVGGAVSAPEAVSVIEQPADVVGVVEEASITNPIDVAAVAPPEVNPIDVVAVAPPEVNPIDIVAVVPPEVNPIDVVAVAPPEINPIDVVAVAPPEVNPIDVVAVAPPVVNPIDVVAVAAPEVNPIDILQPVIVQPAGEIVGPIV